MTGNTQYNQEMRLTVRAIAQKRLDGVSYDLLKWNDLDTKVGLYSPYFDQQGSTYRWHPALVSNNNNYLVACAGSLAGWYYTYWVDVTRIDGGSTHPTVTSWPLILHTLPVSPPPAPPPAGYYG